MIVKCAAAPLGMQALMQSSATVQGCETKFAWHQTLLKARRMERSPKRHASPVAHEPVNTSWTLAEKWHKHE